MIYPFVHGIEKKQKYSAGDPWEESEGNALGVLISGVSDIAMREWLYAFLDTDSHVIGVARQEQNDWSKDVNEPGKIKITVFLSIVQSELVFWYHEINMKIWIFLK